MEEGEKMSVGKQIRIYLTEKGISQTWVSEQAKIALPKLNESKKTYSLNMPSQKRIIVTLCQRFQR